MKAIFYLLDPIRAILSQKDPHLYVRCSVEISC